MDRPCCYWNVVRDILIPFFGLSFKVSISVYLFFEYFGISVRGKNAIIDLPGCKYNFCSSITDGDALDKKFGVIVDYFKGELRRKKDAIRNKISERSKHEEMWGGSKELRSALFGDLLDLLYSNYPRFVDVVSVYLAWNWFCSFQPEGVNKALFRQVQLGIWEKLREAGVLMPIGKIAGDLAEKHFNIQQEKGSLFHGMSDMVDAEGITSVICDGVIFLTFDNPRNIQRRIEIILGILQEAQRVLEKTILLPEKFGSVWCFKKPESESEKIKCVEICKPGLIIKL